MLPRSFEIGPFTIHLYGIIIALAIFVGWYVAKKRAVIYKIPKALFDDPILLLPLILGIVGARAYHVADYWDFYSKYPYSIINIPDGGLGIWGSLVGIAIGFFLIARIKRIELLSILDLVSPSLLLGQAIGRIGNWINQEGFGPPTNLPWGIFISPENRPPQFRFSNHFHPTFFYEAILDLIFFALLFYLTNLSFPRKRESRTGFSIRSRMTAKTGQTFALYLILYSTGRFIAEFWRIDTATIGTLKVAHVLAIIAFMFGIVLLAINKKGADGF